MIPTRSPWIDEAYLATLYIVPDLEFDPEEERKRIAERDRQESIAAARGMLWGAAMAALMWLAFALWCCL